ncbi:putative transport protein [Streptomyces auratus]
MAYSRPGTGGDEPPEQTPRCHSEDVDLVPGFARDVSGLGHHGTGDLEVRLRTPRDVERAQHLFRASYAAA